MKILLAVDGSAYTRRMMAFVAAHADWLGARHSYTVMHVSAALPGRAAAVIDRAVLKTYYQGQSDEVFKPLRTFFQRQGIAASFEARVGSPAFKLSDTADRSGYDLIMLGSHGRSALGNLVLGSVTTQVLALCKTPVLVIR